MLKRPLDVGLSLLGLAVLAPALVATAVGIKLGSQGPVFYRGRRIGRGGQPFEILKFRSMVVEADKVGASSTAGDDPRITRLGAVIRRLKIDELPQLINVLRGEMSLVGPRPQVQWAVDRYDDQERALLQVRPGITDWASLHYRNEGEILRGSRDPDADYLRLIAPGKTRLGLLYVHKHNVITDLRIIAATALCVFGIDPDWCFGPPQREAIAGPDTLTQRRAA